MTLFHTKIYKPRDKDFLSVSNVKDIVIFTVHLSSSKKVCIICCHVIIEKCFLYKKKSNVFFTKKHRNVDYRTNLYRKGDSY